MAGLGSRFRKEGFNINKHEIMYKKISLLEHSLSSLTTFFENEFIFIVKKLSQEKIAFIEEVCKKLEIKKITFFQIEELTNGQATTAFEYLKTLKCDEEIIIFNIDTKLKVENKTKTILASKSLDISGSILTFNGKGDHWSFVKSDSKDIIIDVKEKIRISDYATVGLYHFKSSNEYNNYYKKYSQKILDEYGEVYIAPLYKYFINDGKIIENIHFSGEVIPMGKPEELDEIDKNYDWRKENNNTNI